MTFSLRAIIRALAAPRHRLSCSRTLWHQGIAEVARRGKGQHESGAFLLGRRPGLRGQVCDSPIMMTSTLPASTPALSSSMEQGSDHCGSSVGRPD